jgi:deoxyribonuclease-4
MWPLLFRTEGTPLTVQTQTIVNGIKRIANGLGCTELEFVYGAHMQDAEADQVASIARKLRIRLTAHAPYYINLNAHENDKLIASQDRLLRTAHVASICGASSVTFHAAFYMKDNLKSTQGLKDTYRNNR